MTSEFPSHGNTLHSPPSRQIIVLIQVFCAALAICGVLLSACADEIVMQNGNHYYGKVMSMTTNSLLLQSEMLGNVTLPRAKVKLVTFGVNAPTNSIRPTPQTITSARLSVPVNTNNTSDLSAALRSLQADTNLVRQIQKDYLNAATPEANQKFNQTLNDLASGKLTINDLRGQARTAADQLRAFKRELGEDAGGELDGYLDILDRFLRETESSAGPRTKPVGRPAKSDSASEDE
jgi:hypothetical protein